MVRTLRKEDLRVELEFDPVPDAQDRLLKIFEFLLQEDEVEDKPELVLSSTPEKKVFENSGVEVYNAAQKKDGL